MTTSEFVTDLRDSYGSHLYLRKSHVFLIGGNNDLINDPAFSVFERSGAIFKLSMIEFIYDPVLLSLSDLANNNIVPADLNSGLNETVEIEFIICTGLSAGSFPSSEIRDAKYFISFLAVIVGTEEDRSEEPSVNSTLVQHNGIFLVVTGVAGNCDNGIAT